MTIKTYFLRRNSKEEVFAWKKEKVLPSNAATVTSTTPTELSPYMVKQEAPSKTPEEALKGHDGRLTDNGIVYVFSAKDHKK